jgi:hypothetical protein
VLLLFISATPTPPIHSLSPDLYRSTSPESFTKSSMEATPRSRR